MSITKRLAITQITVVENGTVLVQMAKIIEENGVELSRQLHRTSIEPGVSTDLTIDAVIAHLATPEMGGYTMNSLETKARVKAIAATAQTPAIVKAFTDQRDARDRARNPIKP